MTLLEQIKFEEGFYGEPYFCTENKLTVGYGTTFPLTTEEAELLLKHRLYKKIEQLQKEKPIVLKLDETRQNALYDMAYQLGVNGLLKFRKMWLAIESGDFEKAYIEALDSRWAKQTPNRAKRVATKLKEGKN